MDPEHRDRIAFLRLCSGRFTPRHEAEASRAPAGAMSVQQRRSSSSAHERELAEEACAGDIIGIPNHGMLRIGDTLTEGEHAARSPACPISRRRSCAASGSRIR